MKVDWHAFDYDKFVVSLPKIVRLFLGDALKEKTSKHWTDFFVDSNFVLRVHSTFESIEPMHFDEIATAIAEEAPAGLVVSWQDSPFRVRLLPRGHECWVPVVSWGRKQLAAIANPNRETHDDLLPFADYIPEARSSNLGAGTALWSDIVRFAVIGVQIGQRLGIDPTDVLEKLMRDIGHCFQQHADTWTHGVKVGADGWYHFFREGSMSNAVELGVFAQDEIRRVAKGLFYANTDLHVAMGANRIANCRLDKGGPYDLDSILAIELIKRKEFWNYDLRVTEEILNACVPLSAKPRWQYIDKLDYCGRKTSVFGHAGYPLAR